MFKKIDTENIQKPNELPKNNIEPPKNIYDFMQANNISLSQIQSELIGLKFTNREINILTDLVFNKMNLMQAGMKYNIGIHEIQPFKEKTVNAILDSCKRANVECTPEQINNLIKNIVGI